jgi:hypothetical protein
MRDVTVGRSVADGTELLTVRVHGHDGDDEYAYARPVGQDAWFHFVGIDSNHRDVDPFSPDIDPARRATIDDLLLERDYPIRGHDGTTPPEGQLEILTTEGTRARPFHTHPGTFVVHRDGGPTPTGPPEDETTHIAVLDRGDDVIRVRVDAPGGPPPAYAIREAALAPEYRGQQAADLPRVSVEN